MDRQTPTHTCGHAPHTSPSSTTRYQSIKLIGSGEIASTTLLSVYVNKRGFFCDFAVPDVESHAARMTMVQTLGCSRPVYFYALGVKCTLWRSFLRFYA